jgi:putative redox protein
MPDHRNAHVVETHLSPFSVSMEVNGFRLTGDEPESMGGLNLAPNPYDYLLAALGECTAMTVRWYARQKNWPLEEVKVTLTYDKLSDHPSGKSDIYHKVVILKGDALSPEQKQKLIEVAGKCPVHKTLTQGAFVETAEG